MQHLRVAVDIGGTFTDIMSIPPNVARRAYDAAAAGATSTFFYVRRFTKEEVLEAFELLTVKDGRFVTLAQ